MAPTSQPPCIFLKRKYSLLLLLGSFSVFVFAFCLCLCLCLYLSQVDELALGKVVVKSNFELDFKSLLPSALNFQLVGPFISTMGQQVNKLHRVHFVKCLYLSNFL